MSKPTEVRSQATAPRTFSADERARILQDYDSAATPTARAAVLRREGVYTSHISNWRKARNAGEPVAKTPGRRSNPDAAELLRLRTENDRLQRRLEQADRTIDVLGKVHALLQMAAGESATDEQPSKKR
jgi:transposase